MITTLMTGLAATLLSTQASALPPFDNVVECAMSTALVATVTSEPEAGLYRSASEFWLISISTSGHNANLSAEDVGARVSQAHQAVIADYRADPDAVRAIAYTCLQQAG